MLSLLFCISVSAANSEEVLLKSALQAYQSNDLNQCVKGFYSLIQIQPQKGLYWFNLGNCLFLGGQPAKAISAYDKVIKLQSPLAPAANNSCARLAWHSYNESRGAGFLTCRPPQARIEKSRAAASHKREPAAVCTKNPSCFTSSADCCNSWAF